MSGRVRKLVSGDLSGILIIYLPLNLLRFIVDELNYSRCQMSSKCMNFLMEYLFSVCGCFFLFVHIRRTRENLYLEYICESMVPRFNCSECSFQWYFFIVTAGVELHIQDYVFLFRWMIYLLVTSDKKAYVQIYFCKLSWLFGIKLPCWLILALKPWIEHWGIWWEHSMKAIQTNHFAVMLRGDFRHIFPVILVILKGTRHDIINSSQLLNHCKVLKLTTNMR